MNTLQHLSLSFFHIIIFNIDISLLSSNVFYFGGINYFFNEYIRRIFHKIFF